APRSEPGSPRAACTRPRPSSARTTEAELHRQAWDRSSKPGMVVDSVLWRRLDTPGHDFCRLQRSGAGWKLHGMAVFRQDGVAAGLAYQVACDRTWRTRGGRIRGSLGTRP